MPTVACCRRFARSVTNGTSVYAGLRWALPPWPHPEPLGEVVHLPPRLPGGRWVTARPPLPGREPRGSGLSAEGVAVAEHTEPLGWWSTQLAWARPLPPALPRPGTRSHPLPQPQ